MNFLINHPTLGQVTAPATADPYEVNEALEQAAQQQQAQIQQQQQQAQWTQGLGALGQTVYGVFGGGGMQAQPQQIVVPRAPSGVQAMAMGQNYQQFEQNRIQRQAQSAQLQQQKEERAAQERLQVQKEIQREKDEAAKFKLEEMRRANEERRWQRQEEQAQAAEQRRQAEWEAKMHYMDEQHDRRMTELTTPKAPAPKVFSSTTGMYQAIPTEDGGYRGEQLMAYPQRPTGGGAAPRQRQPYVHPTSGQVVYFDEFGRPEGTERIPGFDVPAQQASFTEFTDPTDRRYRIRENKETGQAERKLLPGAMPDDLHERMKAAELRRDAITGGRFAQRADIDSALEEFEREAAAIKADFEAWRRSPEAAVAYGQPLPESQLPRRRERTIGIEGDLNNPTPEMLARIERARPGDVFVDEHNNRFTVK